MLIRLGMVAILLIGAFCLPRTSNAQTPMTVAVRAEFVVPRFRDRFSNRQAVEARVASLFADYLTRKVGFLRFAVTDSALPYRLSFLLDREPRTTSSFSEVGFWVRLDRPGETQLQMYWLPFRTADQSIAGAGTEAD